MSTWNTEDKENKESHDLYRMEDNSGTEVQGIFLKHSKLSLHTQSLASSDSRNALLHPTLQFNPRCAV